MQFKPLRQLATAITTLLLTTPIEDEDKLMSETISKALKYGWVWRIPLINRIGNGYVYSSDYISEEEAEAELREYLGPGSEGADALHLHWNLGRIERHWKHNCVAIGLSQGFLKPLEALLNSWDDSDYWRNARENLDMSPKLVAVLEAWDADDSVDRVLFENIDEQVYQRTSWYCMLAGMGRFPGPSKESLRLPTRNQKRAREQSEKQACSLHFS